MNKKSLTPLAAISVFVAPLLLTSCFSKPAGGDKKPHGPPMALVELAPIIERESASVVELVGAIKAWRQAAISAEVEGRVVAIDKTEGDGVTVADIVVRLDETSYAIQLQEAEGRLQRAEAEKEKARLATQRAKELFKQGVISEEAAQNAHLTYKGAAAELTLRQAEKERASLTLERCRVKAPFPGQVAALNVDVGQWVKEGQTLFEAVDITTVDARFEVPARSVASLTTGMTAPITIDGVAQKSFTGTITAVAPKADERTRTFLVKMGIDNPDGLIRAGMVARTRLGIATPDKQTMMPRDAVVWRGPKALVFTIDEKGAAHSTVVKLGRQEGALVAELSGAVKPGQKVVVTGNEILRDGSMVNVVGEKEIH